MIEVEGLTKYFGTVPGIKNVTFKVNRGEILGFLGPNGAGKTTTMRILTCYIAATSGLARIAGFDVYENSLEVRRRVGYLPESVPLYLEMMVKDYLLFVSSLKGVPRNKKESHVREIISQCSLEAVESRVIRHLSKGYRQRVGIAQALVGNPDVLILDEPTVGLDPKQIIEIRELIKKLAGRCTIILSTHILPEVQMTCEKVIIINKGSIVAVDTPEKLQDRLDQANEMFLRVQGPRDSVINALNNVNGVTSVSSGEAVANDIFSLNVKTSKDMEIRSLLAKTVVDNGWGLYEMKPVKLSLEDIFVKLVTKEEEVN